MVQRNRRSIRLKGYDYSQVGAYFVTICTKNRECLFGDIVDDKMLLNDAGRIVRQCWDDIPAHFPRTELNAFVIMPNHIHGILVINDALVGANVRAKDFSPQQSCVRAKDFSPQQPNHQPCVRAKDISPQQSCVRAKDISPQQLNQQASGTSKTIGSIVRGFKIGVTKWMRQNTNVQSVWQRNYYEHIIRNDDSFHRIKQYINDNPARWAFDSENPDA